MNSHQRKFLLEEIEKQYRREKDTLHKQKPVHPSLNNYLIAAILDNTCKLRNPQDIEAEVRKRVRDMGKNYTFVTKRDSGWGSRSNEEEDEDMVNLPALLIFEMPKGYAEWKAAYERAKQEWDDKVQQLESSINAMRIKVQVGSDDALESLVQQADQLCSMSLTASSRLLLPAAK